MGGSVSLKYFLSAHLSARYRHVSHLLLLTALAAAATGCGSNNSPSPPATSSGTGTTAVTLLASSTANDQLSQFNLSLTSITLTSQSGKTVTLSVGTQNSEFMHLNGHAEPLVTINVPQDTYTSATATVGSAQFACAALDAKGSLNTSFFSYGATPSSQVTVHVPTPIAIAGPAMGLSLNLQVSPSATYTACVPSGIEPYSINPTFNLAPVTFSSSAGNAAGTLPGLQGLIASVSASDSSLSVTGADGAVWQVHTDGSTVFQGVSGFSALAGGMPVDMDVAIQQDGSMLATRAAVEDTNATNLSVSRGPLLFVPSSVPVLDTLGREQQGYLFKPELDGSLVFNFGNALFQISGQLNNLQTLPFKAGFSAADMAPGQNVLVSSHALTMGEGPSYVPATTVTLVPQTINGVITGISSAGGFTAYTVMLAAYDLFPNLAVQAGQVTQLPHPASVVVYVDSNTQMLNTGSPVIGLAQRFYGLVFNDGGTLRMDCAQVSDGVAE